MVKPAWVEFPLAIFWSSEKEWPVTNCLAIRLLCPYWDCDIFLRTQHTQRENWPWNQNIVGCFMELVQSVLGTEKTTRTVANTFVYCNSSIYHKRSCFPFFCYYGWGLVIASSIPILWPTLGFVAVCKTLLQTSFVTWSNLSSFWLDDSLSKKFQKLAKLR